MTQICIATISRAQTAAEESLLRQSLSSLAALNLPIYITDGGSSASFTIWLASLAGVTVLPTVKGLVRQVKSSVAAAEQSGCPFVLYTEPDKNDFFNLHLPTLLQTTSLQEATGVVLAARSAESFSSFPRFQQMTETAINRCCAECIGLQTDYCYGPFLLNSQLLSVVKELPEEIGWGWRPAVFQTAHLQGYKIDVQEGDFFCPAGQRGDDASERLYRMKQLEQNIRGLVMAAEKGAAKN